MFLAEVLNSLAGWCWRMSKPFSGPQEYVLSFKLRTCINMVMKSKVFWMCYLIPCTKGNTSVWSIKEQISVIQEVPEEWSYVTICTLYSGSSLFVHPLSHTRNSGPVNFSLQFIYYKTQLTIYGHPHNIIQNLKTNWKWNLSLPLDMCVFI